LNMEKYLQGAMEHGLNPNNGVLNGNRGNGDIMSILIRRGREMGLPSFTDVREEVAANPSGCAWNSWTAVGDCDPANLFQPSALNNLKALYNTPGDVELAVGAPLSLDRFKGAFDFNINYFDKTQYELVAGEIVRIINMDTLGVAKCPGVDTFFARLINDDPGSKVTDRKLLPGNQRTFGEKIVSLQAKFATVGTLIQYNTNVKCVKQSSFLFGGWADFVDANFERLTNTYNNGPLDTSRTNNQQLDDFSLVANCDISANTIAAYSNPDFGIDDYSVLVCLDAPGCWTRGFTLPNGNTLKIPFCVD